MATVQQPPPSKVKLDELFFYWISLPDTQTLVRKLLEDLKAGKQIYTEKPAQAGGKSSLSTPYSPTKTPFSPHSPYHGSLSPMSPSSQSLAPPRSPTPRSPSCQSPTRSFNDFPPFDKFQFNNTPKGYEAEEEKDKERAPADPERRLSPRKLSPNEKPPELRKMIAQQRKEIPKFYFPKAPPIYVENPDIAKKIDSAFASFPGGITSVEDFLPVTKTVAELPAFFNGLLFRKIDSDSEGKKIVTKAQFEEFWQKSLGHCDKAGRIFNVLRSGQNDYLTPTDFKPLMREILDTHPGLEFLHATPEFQERYAETVVIRVFYLANRAGDSRLTLKEIQKSKLVHALEQLDEEEDVNVVTDFFSYEHFYVIYCKFWELDTDHNFLIGKKELMRYGNHALTFNIIERVFDQAGRKFVASTPPGSMGYEDFVWFLLSEEDKSAEASLEYWFKCVDLGAKGFITAEDMRFFYQEQMHRMECLAIDKVPFEDICCQMFDMIHPQQWDWITLKDMKRCKTAGIFFNVLFNLNKFMLWEQRDPFLARQDQLGGEASEWERFARFEYARLCMDEEQPLEQSEQELLNPWQSSHESPF